MVVQIVNGVPAKAVEVTPPADAVSGALDLFGISCSSSSACVAVGTYGTAGGTDLPLVLPITGGTPGTPVVPSLPDSYYQEDAELNAVACQPSGACVAVGDYYDTANHDTTLVVPITNGVPGAGVSVLPSDVYSDPDAALDAVACPVSGVCEAIGSYYNSSDLRESLAVPISDGTPGTATEITRPAGAPTGSYVYPSGLSCSTASLCVASGYYYPVSGGDNYLGALAVITGSGASWQTAPLPDDADSDSSTLSSEYENGYSSAVGCAPSGACLATGWYYTDYDSGYSYSGLAQEVTAGGGIANPLETPSPAHAYQPQYSYLDSGTGCVDAGSCVAGGGYYTADSVLTPYVVAEQAPLSLSTSSLSAGTVGSSYQAILAANGGWGSDTWSVSSGSLPAGLSLNSSTGVISGTPTSPGTASFTVEVTGTGSPVPTATGSLSITVASAPTPPPSPVPVTAPTVVKPVVLLLSHSGLVKRNRLSVKLACSEAACAGTLRLEVREVVTVKRGKKRVRKHVTVLLGSRHYAASVGTTSVLPITLNRAGRKALAAAKHHRLGIAIVATVAGGTTTSRHETIRTATTSKKK